MKAWPPVPSISREPWQQSATRWPSHDLRTCARRSPKDPDAKRRWPSLFRAPVFWRDDSKTKRNDTNIKHHHESRKTKPNNFNRHGANLHRSSAVDEWSARLNPSQVTWKGTKQWNPNGVNQVYMHILRVPSNGYPNSANVNSEQAKRPLFREACHPNTIPWRDAAAQGDGRQS